MTEMERTFGIEIECFGSSRMTLYAALTAAGLSVNRVDGEDTNYNPTEKWTLKGDGSIRPTGGKRATELTSPILVGEEGLTELRTACGVLKRLRFETNNSCGIHVHIGVDDMTGMEAYNVVRRYAEGETEIDSFMKSNRRGDNSGYAQSLTRAMETIAANQDVWNKAGRPPGFVRAHYKRDRLIPNMGSLMDSMDSFCRYSGAGKGTKVNVGAFFRFGTIEFRQHHGSVEADELVNWVQFLLNFVDRSVTLTTSKTARDNGPMTGLPTSVRRFFRRKIAERSGRMRAA